MTININHLVRVSNAKYNGFVRRFTGEKGLSEALDYETFVFNGVVRYVTTGDPTHLNNCVSAARNMGKVRLTTRLMKGMSAHEWNASKKEFNGRARPGKLRALRKLGEDGIASKFADVLEKEQAQEQKAAKEWSEESFLKAVVKTLGAHEANVISFADKLKAMAMAA